MPDGPDPLGKRALFWAPAQRDDGPLVGEPSRDDLGRHALYSAPEAPKPKSRTAKPARGRTRSIGEGQVSKRAKTHSAAEVSGEHPRSAPPRPRGRARTAGGAGSHPRRSYGRPGEADLAQHAGEDAAGPSAAKAAADSPYGPLGPIELSCSSCGERSEVALVDYLVLHLPLWLWRPGRGYTRFMNCPACGRRTWVSASWRPWERG